MPRRSGTTTVWLDASAAASGAHMSPVSPKPCSMTTAGPCPPTRTWMVAPSVSISRVWTLDGYGATPAMAALPSHEHTGPQLHSQERLRRPARAGADHLASAEEASPKPPLCTWQSRLSPGGPTYAATKKL